VAWLRKIPRLGNWGLVRLGAAQVMAGDMDDATATAAKLKVLQPGFDAVDYQNGFPVEVATPRYPVKIPDIYQSLNS
jgi:hypothetical protein